MKGRNRGWTTRKKGGEKGKLFHNQENKVSVYLREGLSERVGKANGAGERSEVEEEKRREEEKRERTIRQI